MGMIVDEQASPADAQPGRYIWPPSQAWFEARMVTRAESRRGKTTLHYAATVSQPAGRWTLRDTDTLAVGRR